MKNKLENRYAGSFHDNPIVYFLITDRFYRSGAAMSSSTTFGDTDVATFHGGNLAGITIKLKEGWFTRLGVNAIWITAPYEQIHGWVPGGDGKFKHYAYHGYYALDYTVLDKNAGTSEDLKELVTVAHAAGIRVIFDVVMNHPGYEDLVTFNHLGINVHLPGWEEAMPDNYGNYLNRNSAAFADWWGPAWIRCDLPGYTPGGSDELTMQVSGLPDFKTEDPAPVALPKFLKNKPDTKAVDLPNTSVRGYLVNWLTEWVRQYGIDGFRCDSVKHVEMDAWSELKTVASKAIAEWKANNEREKIDDAPFWMVGEVYGNGIARNSYFDNGFDSLLNFQFQYHLREYAVLDELYETYAIALNGNRTHNVLSYISSHDTYLYDRSDLWHGSTALMLAPGGVQIFYGDETARPEGPFIPSDPVQATRSDMNWDSVDEKLLLHWQKLGQFRSRHVAIAKGCHKKICDLPYVFSRVDDLSGDRVIAAIDVRGLHKIAVGEVFPSAVLLRDAYSGNLVEVRNGIVELVADGVVLLELAA